MNQKKEEKNWKNYRKNVCVYDAKIRRRFGGSMENREEKNQLQNNKKKYTEEK